MALDYSIIGNRIKTIRKKKKITQATLAEALDVSDSTISRIERGDLKLSLSRLNQICEVLEVKEGEILNGASFTSPQYLNSDMANLLKETSPQNQKLIYAIAKTVNEVLPNLFE